MKVQDNQPIDEDRLDAASILASLTKSTELEQVQNSLYEFSDAVANGDKSKLAAILSKHSLLLDSLSVRLLDDAIQCQNTKLTVTLIELALKSFETTRRTIIATNDFTSTPVPMVAVQING